MSRCGIFLRLYMCVGMKERCVEKSYPVLFKGALSLATEILARGRSPDLAEQSETLILPGQTPSVTTSPKSSPKCSRKSPEPGRHPGKAEGERMLQVRAWRNWEKIEDLFPKLFFFF